MGLSDEQPQCRSRTHYFTEEHWGEKPFCDCGEVRNLAYRRTFWERLTGRPRRG